MTGTLEQRIERVEQRLQARERQIRVGVEALGARVQAALRPGRLVIPALGVALSLLAAGWMLHRLRRPRNGKVAPADARPVAASYLLVPLALVRAATWVWPLVPAPWRARARTASSAALIAALGLPLFESLFRRPPPAD